MMPRNHQFESSPFRRIMQAVQKVVPKNRTQSDMPNFVLLCPAVTQVALTFLDDFGAESDRLTYKEVKTRAQAVAAGLTSGGYSLKPGDRVLLVYLPSLDFIIAFLGSIMAQLVPVPVFPPGRRRVGSHG